MSDADRDEVNNIFDEDLAASGVEFQDSGDVTETSEVVAAISEEQTNVSAQPSSVPTEKDSAAEPPAPEAEAPMTRAEKRQLSKDKNAAAPKEFQSFPDVVDQVNDIIPYLSRTHRMACLHWADPSRNRPVNQNILEKISDFHAFIKPKTLSSRITPSGGPTKQQPNVRKSERNQKRGQKRNETKKVKQDAHAAQQNGSAPVSQAATQKPLPKAE